MKKVLLSLMAAGLLLASVATAVLARPAVDLTPELKAAKAATAEYNAVTKALADGYVQVSPLIPGMGYHYVNFALLDGTFDVAAPEILLYDDAGNGRRLIGVEYAVVGPPPEGFTGVDDVWEPHPASCHYDDDTEEPCDSPADADPDKTLDLWHPGMWALHVWLWQENPVGIFAPFNPNLP